MTIAALVAARLAGRIETRTISWSVRSPRSLPGSRCSSRGLFGTSRSAIMWFFVLMTAQV